MTSLLPLLLGCVSPPSSGPEIPTTSTATGGPRDLQVVVSRDWFSIYHANDVDCWCASNWPLPDTEALAYIDAAECTCDPVGCIDGIAVLRDGVEVDRWRDSDWNPGLMYWGVEDFNLPAAGTVEIQLEGCGEPARVPLTRPAIDVPAERAVWASGVVKGGELVWPVTVGVNWQAAPAATGSIMIATNWHDGWWRRESDPNPTSVWNPDWFDELQPGLLQASAVHETVAGAIEVTPMIWGEPLARFDTACPVAEGRWSLLHDELFYGDWPCTTCPVLSANGEAPERVWRPARAEVVQGASGLLLEIEGQLSGSVSELRYLEGDVEDTLALHSEGKWWVGTVPHVPAPVAFGAGVAEPWTRALGDLEFESDGEPGTTRIFTDVTLEWEALAVLRVETGGSFCQ